MKSMRSGKSLEEAVNRRGRPVRARHGAMAAADGRTSREKFFTLGGVWLAVMEGNAVARSYRHVAFKVDAAELPALEAKLRSLGVEIQPSRPRVEGEGQSLYFYDFDDNLIAHRYVGAAPTKVSTVS